MTVIYAFIIIILAALALVPFAAVQWKGVITVCASIAMAILSSSIAMATLAGKNFEYLFAGSLVTGIIPVRIDALSAWFILLINFTFITGAVYGFHYMKAYRAHSSNCSLHGICFILLHASLIGICSLQNMIAFLVAWEIMALSSFILVIFEHTKKETLNAGINYLIQSHVCILFLTLGFTWVAMRTNSYDFKAITIFSNSFSTGTGIALFLCFFFGFAIKAGFVPFHTWLPYAHPAAPAHVSAIMSGIMIKLGIYGMLRILLLIKSDYVAIGYIILFFSIISGLYGVMLAILQHNLKRLLAYHTIENIGIIGIGIGIGCIGIGKGNQLLTVLGFGGALLHSLNHSLFKSLLFFAAGNVYQSAHTMDIEKMGGLAKQMPHTAMLFLIASLAICGLPPFNGFVSEFLIYSGLFGGLHGSDKMLLSSIVCALFALSLIGGLALLCFTKAFGAVFLGMPRHHFHHVPEEAAVGKLIPMYAVVLLILAIGLFPAIFMNVLSKPVALFTQLIPAVAPTPVLPVFETISMIGTCSLIFLLLCGLIYFIRKRMTANKMVEFNSTWVCGYTAPTAKMQYTASSFVRAYRKLFEPIFSIRKKKRAITGIFPKAGGQETFPYDKAETWLVDYPLHRLKSFFNRFIFLQNGNLQFYILYGVIFITGVMVLPYLVDYFKLFIQFLNAL